MITGIDEKLKERIAVKEQEAPTPLRYADVYKRQDYGKAFADTAVTGKVSRPRAERQIDGESVLERAAETSAEMPDLDGDAPASWLCFSAFRRGKRPRLPPLAARMDRWCSFPR